MVQDFYPGRKNKVIEMKKKKTKRKKICFVVPESGIGGIVSATMDFAMELKKRYDISVVAMTKKKDKKYENYKGIKIHRVLCRNIKGFGGSQFFFIKRAPDVIKKFNPDVVYGQTIFPSGAISARFKDKITICHGRGTDVTYSLGMKKYYLLNRYALKNNKYVFAKNKMDARKIRKFYNREVIVFPTGFNIPKIRGSSAYWKKKLGLDEHKFHILYVGRGMKFKGVNYLMDAVRDMDDVRLHLIGIEKKLPREDVFKYIKACDVFVYPEVVGQGLSNAVLEAMSLKLPVIGTNVGFFRELITDGKDGILVKPKSSKEIRKAILKLKANANLRKRIGENGYMNIKNNYTMKKMVEALEKYI